MLSNECARRKGDILVWNQSNSDAHMVELNIPQQVSSEMYYATYSAVDNHNRRSWDDIKLEKHFSTHSWEKNVNLSMLGVSVIYTCNYTNQSLAYEETCHLFLCDLGE